MTLINWVEIGQVDLKNICEKQNYNVRRLKLPWPAKYLKETPLCNVSSKLAIKHKDICDDTNHDFFISEIYKMRQPCQVCPKSEPRDKKKFIKHFSNKNCLKDANNILKYDGTCIVHLQTYYFNTSSGL
jgi:hypothetical protein